MNRLVIFGCSHSEELFYKYFKKYSNVIRKSNSGNANSKIIWDVYHFVKSNDYNPETDILSIQYTYTNRFWVPNHLPNDWSSFHSFKYDIGIYINLPDSIKKELNKFYETYIKYFWNYDTALQTQIMEIEKLKAFLNINNVKFIHWTWTDGGNTDEWNTEKIFKNNQSIDINDELKKMECEQIDEYYLCRNWGLKNNYLKKCDHLNDIGNQHLGRIITEIIENKFNLKNFLEV